MINKYLIAMFTVILISGCSKKTEEMATEASADAQPAQVSTQQAQAAESTSNEPSTTPATTQKPETILNEQVNPAEASRKMVREANVSFESKDVVKTALEIEKLTLSLGGFIEQKNIDFVVQESQSYPIADGKIKIFEKVNPQAEMIIRVPSEKAAHFVNQLLPLMHFLNHQQYSAKRYELKLLEEKMSQTQVVPDHVAAAQVNEISRLTRLEVQDRVRYSTIVIGFTQPATVREHIDINLDAIAQLNGDSFWQRAWYGIQKGWQFVLSLLVVLITIWPLYLIIIIGLIAYRVMKPYLQKWFK